MIWIEAVQRRPNMKKSATISLKFLKSCQKEVDFIVPEH